MGRYLTDLADVVRAAGLAVVEEPGWQTRARSSGGYGDGRPTHIMCHHTASGPGSDGQADVDYMCYGSDIRPVANLYLARNGQVWIMAAGATNTNGSGVDPCALTADDDMNVHAVGIEAANGGTGEPWPDIQQDAYVTLVAALCAAYTIDTGRVHAHFEWAPSRKIDPAGESRYADGAASWNMDIFRGDIATPPSEENPMVFRTSSTADAIYAQGDDMNVRHVTAQEGAIAEALTPGWADSAPTIDVADDVADWLSSL
jgi:hypothetical protein